MFELFLSAFATLFVVIDPPGCAPIYAGLTKEASNAERRSMAIRAVIIATIILLVFALFGEDLLNALHIELDAFRIAGGLMLFLIALDMVFEKRTQRREERAEKIIAENERTHETEDVSVFPMAMPMLAGARRDYLRHAAERARGWFGRESGGSGRVRGGHAAYIIGIDHGGAVNAARGQKVRGGDHPAARRPTGGLGGAVRY